ncbi:glutactin [Drosophila albomicans]|uniref:Carboxylic ester hydrolase n=1 Tax=Drosophila albomicans TaxID=7291 RepID=A0A6P8YP88_DROAB|nr:glutactin [Drosophila albomicans]
MRRGVVYVMLTFCGILCALLAAWLIIHADASFVDEPVPIFQRTATVELADKQGAVRGNYGKTAWTNQSILQFRGIPYAEAPVESLRFKAPVERLPWTGTHDALDFGQRCPVITNLDAQLSDEQLEDCLNLCVYTKNLTARQPVMFYVYGGGYYNGSSQDHPPNYLLEKDVVLVVPHYRVGALGWLTTLSEDLPGNAPIGDILLALNWVQKHISKFGGDPSQVTIFGQSAGAGVTSALLLSPRSSDQQFQRAIVQSGSIFASWAITKEPAEQARRICEQLGCEQCDKRKKLLSCVQNASVKELLLATQEESFSPVVGDLQGILPQQPQQVLDNYQGVPLMTGFTQHDGSFVLASYYDIVASKMSNVSALSVRQFTQALMDLTKDATGLADQLLYRLLFTPELLNSHDHNEALPAYFDLTSTVYMKSPVINLASKLLTKQPSSPVYVYSFEYEGEHTRFGYEFGNEQYPFNGGVHHSNDNLYLFATHPLQGNDTLMAQRMVDIWTSFAITGVPNGLAPLSTPSGPYNRLGLKVNVAEDLLETLTTTIDDPDNKRFSRKVSFKTIDFL